MNLVDKANHFASLHVRGKPLVLYNIWDAAGARALAQAGAAAVATGSWSVAAAHGYEDGERIPLAFVETLLARIVASTELPVTVDFESGYATAPAQVADNVARLLDLGVVGINFEDWLPGGHGVLDVPTQCARIDAIRMRAGAMPLFINARTDLFLRTPAAEHAGLLASAIERAQAYRDAGASGFFAPGLADAGLIGELCAASPLPVNIMMKTGVPPVAQLAAQGVARVSYGPLPFFAAMETLQARAREALG